MLRRLQQLDRQAESQRHLQMLISEKAYTSVGERRGEQRGEERERRITRMASFSNSTNSASERNGAAVAPAVGPCARACLSLCAGGLRICIFGGFDGDSDLSDLWTLDLEPRDLAE